MLSGFSSGVQVRSGQRPATSHLVLVPFTIAAPGALLNSPGVPRRRVTDPGKLLKYKDLKDYHIRRLSRHSSRPGL